MFLTPVLLGYWKLEPFGNAGYPLILMGFHKGCQNNIQELDEQPG
jgi:hypothetical protein